MIRSTCILFGLLALVLQGSSGLHMLLVEHSRCAEHGELVHGDAHPHDPGQSGHAESAELRGTPEAGTDGNHDHCSVYTDRRTALVSIADLVAGIRVTETKGDLRLSSAVVYASTARFRIVAKTSPPA